MNSVSLSPPDFDAWGGEVDQDIAFARSLFLNKTNEEIVPLLERNYLMRALDLAIMPDRAFEYYVDGFAEYIERRVVDDEEFGILLHSFLMALSRRQESSPALNRFWERSLNRLDYFSVRVAAGKINPETRSELLREINNVYAGLGLPPSAPA